MKFTTLIFIPSVLSLAAAAPLKRQDGALGLTFAQIDALTPPFGHNADVNPTGTGDCDGAVNDANGNPIKIPCDCPPDRTLFIESLIANLDAGHVVNNTAVGISFPTDNSIPSIQARFNAATVTLQNFRGLGVGCPQAATTWSAQLNAILSGSSTPSSIPVSTTGSNPPATTTAATTAPPSSTSSASTPSETTFGGLTLDQINSLTPDLGFTAGKNPTGTGDCDGAVNDASGNPIKIPCSCPPARDVFIQSLAEDIAAGHAVHNPSVAINFPTDNSIASQISRVQASLVALQNLNGEGVGCPAVSTTLSSQLQTLINEQ